MKKMFLSIFASLLIMSSMAQDNLQNEIRSVVLEGKQIYKVEMANWNANKLFLEKYKGKVKAAGNISYSEGEKIKSVFFTAGEKPKALGTISFDDTYDEKTTQVDLTERALTSSETELVKLRNASFKAIEDETFFTLQPNSKLTVIPLIINGAKKAFVLTSSQLKNTVVFGSDYVLTFDDNFKLSDKKRLHKTTAFIPYGNSKGEVDYKRDGTHTHVAETGDMLISTDIATLLLYEKLTKWEVHTFISENYIFIWNSINHELQAIPKGAPKK